MNELVKAIPETLLEIMKMAPSYHDRKVWFIHNNQCGGEHYLITGKLLFDAKRSKDWEHDGSCARNFYHWAEGELRIKRSDAQRRMSVWEAISPRIKDRMEIILETDVTKLAMIAPFMLDATPEEQDDLLHEAKENNVRDLDNNLKARKGLPTTDECAHDGEVKTLEICKLCKKVLYNSDFKD